MAWSNTRGIRCREVLQEMCSVLPEDKQGPVLDDIRKISKERRRHRGTTRIVASAVRRRSPDDDDNGGLAGVYRSTSELFVDGGCGGRVLETAADRFPAVTAGSTLMATVRAARRKQSMSATVVYNPAFYDAPVAYAPANGPPPAAAAATGVADNPAGQLYLRMTPENGFSLQSRPPRHQRRSEPTTQL